MNMGVSFSRIINGFPVSPWQNRAIRNVRQRADVFCTLTDIILAVKTEKVELAILFLADIPDIPFPSFSNPIRSMNKLLSCFYEYPMSKSCVHISQGGIKAGSVEDQPTRYAYT